MKLEETITFYGLNIPRRHIKEHYHELCQIPAQELYDVLVEHDVPLNKNACRLNYSENIRIPLGTQLPENFFCKAQSYEFFGGEQQQYSISLTFNIVRFGHLQAEYIFDGLAKRECEATIRKNIDAAFETLKERYDLEISEDERKRKEESDRFESDRFDYVHPNSFGGTDF